jgi:dihydrofolate reductase
MEGISTVAVIFGGDNFAAEKLKSRLSDQGIKVVIGDYEEIPENSAYIFDFEGREDVWSELNKNQRLVLIKTNNGGLDVDKDGTDTKEKLVKLGLNWRIVFGENVYGEGMDENSFLGRAFFQAAKNKNLVLPSLKQIYRVLAVDDFVEAILRACFFSGTSGKILVIGGKEINSKIVAEVLVEEAKMTKTQVIQDDQVIVSTEVDVNLVEESRQLLRWEPEITFTEGAKTVIQYFVARIDQENRRKKTEVKKQKAEIKSEKRDGNDERRESRFVVEVEEEEEVRDEKAETREEDKMEEFKIERFSGKSPLPERKEIEKRDEILETREPDELLFPTAPPTQEAAAVKEVKEEEIQNPPFPMDIGEISLDEGRLKKNNRRYYKWGMWGIGWIFLVLFLVNFIKIVTIPKKILGTESLIEKGKYSEATKEIEKLTKYNGKLLSMFGGGNVGVVLRAEGEVVDLLGLSVNLAQSGEKISGGIFGEKEIDMKTELQNLEKNLDEVISKMGILQGRLSGQWRWLPGRFQNDLSKLKEKLSTERQNAERIRKILPVMPEILGLDGKRREYMVLLQNENEIRPSGGFIGSYAILSFEGGKLLGFEVKDVYEADGQLKGHVEPPAEIKKYLGEAAWFMRDANWQASFPLVSKDVQWFLEKETGRKVDGVIALDLAAVKSILGVTGEIYVADFKEKVNSSNLYEQAEYYSETKFFPGSVQKASFLGGVSKQLIEEIKSAKGVEGQKLLSAVMDLLDRNEIQVALNESKTAGVFADAGWDGSIYDGKCNGDKCFADYLYIVEANLGVNKANYFLYRNIERQIEIGEKIIKNNLKITYENTAKSSAWPGGDYKNYMRIYLPIEANVQEVNWSNNGSGEKKIISGDDLKISQVGSKREVGFLVTVPVGKKINVEVNYTESIDLSTLQNFSYLNYIQRQSGFGDTGMVSLISIPDNWQINAVEPAASVVGGKLLFNQKLDRDIKMGVEISR